MHKYCVLCTHTVIYCVYCDISAGLIRQTYLCTCYMGLFFDMRVSTCLILLLQCPIMTYILQALCVFFWLCNYFIWCVSCLVLLFNFDCYVYLSVCGVILTGVSVCVCALLICLLVFIVF
jgi:hypothetical protein